MNYKKKHLVEDKMKKRIGYLGIALLIGLSGCSESTTVEVESSATESVVEETTLEESLEETTAMVERTTIESSSKDLQDEMLSEYAREKYKGECITFDYREYFRYEDEYKGTQVYLVAQVDQILDGKEFRCYSVEGDEYLVRDKRELDKTKLLVNDLVVVWGEYVGTTKITRAINNVEEEILVLDAKYIDIYENGMTFDDYYSYYQSPAPTSEPQYNTMYVVNCNESITLRTDPFTSASEICQIPLGEAVSYISSSENGFYQISYLGYTGYALASYLSQDAPSINDTLYPTMIVVNCNESITLRTSPSTSASEICQIPLGEAVSYIETAANGFYKITYLGKTGYALASYLEFE
mgnify:FL=1|nr:SH3 domain-containing protein [uncultured Anaerotignum sp.]